jgi:hypothetical protein
VKAGVSKVVQGVHDRVLTVVGSLKSVAKVSSLDIIYESTWDRRMLTAIYDLGVRIDCPNTSR